MTYMNIISSDCSQNTCQKRSTPLAIRPSFGNLILFQGVIPDVPVSTWLFFYPSVLCCRRCLRVWWLSALRTRRPKFIWPRNKGMQPAPRCLCALQLFYCVVHGVGSAKFSLPRSGGPATISDNQRARPFHVVVTRSVPSCYCVSGSIVLGGWRSTSLDFGIRASASQ